MGVARSVVLSTERRYMRESRARARSAAARSVERARIALLEAVGMQDKQIAARLRTLPENEWRGSAYSGSRHELRNRPSWASGLPRRVLFALRAIGRCVGEAVDTLRSFGHYRLIAQIGG